MDNEIKKSVLSFPVEFEKINDYAVEDDRFTKVRIWLMHTGLNENNGVFDKEIVNDAIPTIEYCPIVGFIEENIDGKDFTGHKYVLTKDENGIHRKYIGHAYGVVLSNEDNNAHYEIRTCDDGIDREFVVVDGLVWNVFEDTKKILDRDMIKKHSMELYPESVDGYEDEDGIFHYTKFSFRAACILGNDMQYEPAMQNSTVEVQDFTITDFVKQIQNEISDKYVTFTKMVSEDTNIEIDKGGMRTMAAKTDFQTVMQQFNDISTTVSQFEVFEDRWGDAVPRYYAVDIQDNEVIVVDRKNNYQYVGLPFTMNGDKAEIDFANGNRKKICYENYEEGTNDVPEGAFDFGNHIEEIEKTAFEKVQEAETKVIEANEAKDSAITDYTKIKEDYDEIKPKYDDFVKAEKEAELKAIEDAKTSMFEKFEDSLSENEDYKEIKENRNDFTVEEIEQKCSILFTRMSLQNKIEAEKVDTDFTKNETVKVMDDDCGIEDETGYVSTPYGNIPVNR